MKNVNLVELLQTLSLKGVNLWCDGNNLRSSGSKNVLTPAIINKLKQNKSEIIHLLNHSPNILNVYPLSYGQKSLWFIWQLSPKTGAYNFSFAADIYSKLDIKVWHQIFQELRERHPILCSTFPMRGEEPIRWVNQQQKLDFWEIDVSDLNEEALNSKVNEFHNSPFNLETEQVMRVRWFTKSNQKHIMLLTIHHIACDGWSIDLIIKELSKIYQSKTSSVETNFIPLQHSYQDYVLWQREMLESAEGEKIWSYWKQKLAGELPILNLPIDKPRPPIQTYNGASYRFKLPEKLSQGVKQLAQKKGATLYMVLLASFQVLLYRYTGQNRILVGSPNSGRSRTEFASIIGYFVNQIVLQGDFSNNQSFEEYLNQVRHTVLEVLTYPDYPFALLVEKLQPERDLSCSPIFQTYFAFQQFQGKSEDAHNVVMGTQALIKWGDLELLPLAMPNQEGIFDLMLVMAEENESLVGAFSYNRDLFEEKTITKMVGHFQILLDAIVGTPEQAITKLPILTPKELQQILVDWNQTIKNYHKDKCIHQLFAVQAEKSPDAVAVVFENQQLTYSQLNTKANQLAHYLQKLGIRPEERVGICLERSLEMVVGLLAILKAGGAYVPLDHKYPSERLAYMVSDASVSLLLTQVSLQGSLPEYQGKVICLDRDKEIIAQQSQDHPQTEVNSQNLAYVIYTSGSTGKPKGVAIEHKSPIALINWAKEVFIKPELAGVLASTSICFDLSIFELLFPLTQGGKVILVENILDLPKLKDSKTVTLVNTVPSAITELLKIKGVPDSVKVVNLAGEALKNQLVQQLYQEENIEKVYNLYGPSEDTTYSTFALVEKGATQEPTIGRPIANTQTYILDENLQPMPVGVAGELYIGGDGLARGYLNQPELTAQRFIPNPFENSTNKSEKSRVYKTGDLARYIEDGRIEYLGRIDNQVKLRGFRIELGEIEVALTSHPQVQQAVVMVREDISGSQLLVGYVVSEDKLLSRAELFSCLQDKLPLYMVPSAFVILEALPLTPNGKIDRKALSAKEAELMHEEKFLLPRDSLESQLAKIWSEILNIQLIGIRNNFFKLGGNSLVAIRLMAKIEQSFGKNLPLASLFQNQTIEQLAVLLRQSTDSFSWSSLVPIQISGSKLPFFCIPGAGGNVVYLSDLVRYLASDQPFYALQAVGLDGESKPYTRIEDMAGHYIKSIQSVQPHGPYLLGGHSFGGHVVFEIAQQLQRKGEEIALLAIFDTNAPQSENKMRKVTRDWDEAMWMTFFARVIEHLFQKDLGVSYEALLNLPSDQQLNYISECLQAVNIYPPGTGLQQIRGFLQVFKSNNLFTYFPDEIQPTQITLFQAQEDYPEHILCGISFEDIKPENMNDPLWGWSEVSTGPVEVHSVPGDHITIMKEPHVQVIAQKLMACIERASRARGLIS